MLVTRGVYSLMDSNQYDGVLLRTKINKKNYLNLLSFN